MQVRQLPRNHLVLPGLTGNSANFLRVSVVWEAATMAGTMGRHGLLFRPKGAKARAFLHLDLSKQVRLLVHEIFSVPEHTTDI